MIARLPDTERDFRLRRHWVGKGAFREVQSVSITYARTTSRGRTIRETLTTRPTETEAVAWLSMYLQAKATP